MLAVIICNLGPGHSDEVVGHEDRYASLDLVDVVFAKRWSCIQNETRFSVA